MSSDSIELVAVQPFMRVEDYVDAAAFAAKINDLAERIAAARERDAGSCRPPSSPVASSGTDTDALVVRDARRFNASYTFAPDGRCVNVTRKVHLAARVPAVRTAPGAARRVDGNPARAQAASHLSSLKNLIFRISVFRPMPSLRAARLWFQLQRPSTVAM